MTESVVQLADAADVAAAFGRALTPTEQDRVAAILDKASELFRRASRQQFTPGESTNILKVTDGYVTPSQRPVNVVSTVKRNTWNYEVLPFELFENRVHVHYVESGDMLRVTYTHGGTVPDLVRLTIAEIAKKVLSVPLAAQGGVVQASETTGPFTESETYATWAQGGTTMLAPDDLATAQSYRVKTYGSIVQNPSPRNSWFRR